MESIWISECVYLYFLIMRSDIVEHHILTSEPFEDTNAMLRGIQREFILRSFLNINKLHRIWTAMLKGNMKNRKEMSGCAAALVSSVTGKSAGSFPGPVKIQDSTAQSPLLQVSGFTVSGIIW